MRRWSGWSSGLSCYASENERKHTAASAFTAWGLPLSEPRILRFHLHAPLRKRAEAGKHNFINRISAVVQRAGFSVEFHPAKLEDLLLSAQKPGYAMFHMDEPTHPRAMTMRKAYEYPFWAIETSGKRWEWAVAMDEFPAGSPPSAEAARYFRYWRNRLFGSVAETTRRDGFIYVPLQGKLLSQRSFQSCSPLDMIQALLHHDPDRRVIATLHPKEHYSDAERFALDELVARHDRLSLDSGNMSTLLASCDYVATQNSSVAFSGYFFCKPAVLFARIDFHHIAANVHDLGVDRAIARAPGLAPDFAAYIHWYWQLKSINAGHENADDKIRSRLLAAGWPV